MMSRDALEELQRLELISLNRNPSWWMKEQQGVLKICSLNVAGLNAHFEDLTADERIRKADILLLQETSLNVGDENCYEMTSHPFQFHVRGGRGKGVSVYMNQKYDQKTWYIKEGFQIAMISLRGLRILNIYRSSSSSKEAFCDKVEEMLDSSDSPIICKDFNVCGQQEKTTKILRFLASLGLKQLVDGATQIQGRQIDHVYIREEMKTDVLDIERCSLYYSDHDALLLTLMI